VNDAEDRAPVAHAVATTARPHYLVQLSEQLYALPQSADFAICWVQRALEPTYLPTLPAWCLGLVNQRNMPALLVDLRAVFGAPSAAELASTEHARHVFVEHDGETIGFLVDRTHRFRLLPEAVGVGGELITGSLRLDGEIVHIVDLAAVWSFVVREVGTSAVA
jgi:chemotaxis signal transduction protein